MTRSLLLCLFTAGTLLSVTEGRAQTEEYKLIHQGNSYFRAKKYDKANTYYLQALKKNPHNTRATFNLADTYLAQGNAHDADSLYHLVTQTEKNRTIRAMAYHNQGYIDQVQALSNPKVQQQLLRRAIEHYKDALRLTPADNDTRYNLALCQKQLKESQQQQQQQQQQPEKGKDNQPQPQQSQQKQPQPQQPADPQTEQFLNLARQAERRTLEKLKSQQPRQRSLDKNW